MNWSIHIRSTKQLKQASACFLGMVLGLVLGYVLIPQGLVVTLTEGAQRCSDERYGSYCLDALAEDLYYQYDLEDILSAMSNEQRHPTVASTCHELAHALGHRFYATYEKPGLVFSLVENPYVCSSGLIHGVIEEYFIQEVGNVSGSFETVRDLSDTLCKNVGSLPDQGTCYHGVGHGLMFITDLNIPAALEGCEVVPERWQFSCQFGAFMENVLSLQPDSTHVSKYIDESTSFYPCTLVEDEYKDACYFNFSLNAMIRTHYDFDESARICAQAPEEYSDKCFAGLGLFSASHLEEYTETRLMCEEGAPTATRSNILSCIGGVVGGLSQRYSGASEKLTPFCEGFPDGERRSRCIEFVGLALIEWSENNEVQAEACDAFASREDALLCQNIALEYYGQ